MSDELPETWPLRPSQNSTVTHGLCMALVDIVHGEGARMPRRVFLEMCAIATAAELFSGEVSHFFGNQRGDDQELLEALEARWLETKIE